MLIGRRHLLCCLKVVIDCLLCFFFLFFFVAPSCFLPSNASRSFFSFSLFSFLAHLLPFFPVLLYAKALKKAQCEGVETTIHKRCLFFAGAVQWTSNERLNQCVMFATMTGGVNPGRGRPEKNWAQCLVDDIRVFEATEGSTDSSPLLFGVETVLWPRAAKKGGSWHRGVVDAADRFMTRWHRGEVEKS